MRAFLLLLIVSLILLFSPRFIVTRCRVSGTTWPTTPSALLHRLVLTWWCLTNALWCWSVGFACLSFVLFLPFRTLVECAFSFLHALSLRASALSCFRLFCICSSNIAFCCSFLAFWDAISSSYCFSSSRAAATFALQRLFFSSFAQLLLPPFVICHLLG